MSFEAILHKIMEQCGGCVGVALIGTDGIPVVQIQPEGAEGGPLSDDIGIAGVEFGRVLGEVSKAADALAGGAVSEAVFSMARFTVILRPVDEDVFVALALEPHGNLGKARYLVGRHVLELRQEL